MNPELVLEVAATIIGIEIFGAIIYFHFKFIMKSVQIFKMMGGRNAIDTMPAKEEIMEILEKKRKKDRQREKDNDMSYQDIYKEGYV